VARFADRVVATAARLIDDATGTFTLIRNFLGECGVPGEVLSTSSGGSGGRLGFLQRVLAALDEHDPDLLHVVLQELVSRLSGLRRWEEVNRLSAALRERGFDVTEDGKLRPSEILVDETEGIGDYLDDLITRNQDQLTLEGLRHHLEQHRTLYSQGTSPGAAAGQARQFIEQLLFDIATAIANERGHSPDLSRPVRVRKYLREQEFFHEDELRRLVEGVYGYLSEVGAHPGVTDTTIGRMAHVVFLNFGVYLLEKFQAFRGT